MYATVFLLAFAIFSCPVHGGEPVEPAAEKANLEDAVNAAARAPAIKKAAAAGNALTMLGRGVPNVNLQELGSEAVKSAVDKVNLEGTGNAAAPETKKADLSMLNRGLPSINLPAADGTGDLKSAIQSAVQSHDVKNIGAGNQAIAGPAIQIPNIEKGKPNVGEMEKAWRELKRTLSQNGEKVNKDDLMAFKELMYTDRDNKHIDVKKLSATYDMQVADVAGKIDQLGEAELHKLRRLISRQLGKELTNAIFNDANKLRKEVQKKEKELHKDFHLNKKEAKALWKLEGDVQKNADGKEGLHEKKLVAEAWEKIQKLSPQEQTMLYAEVEKQLSSAGADKMWQDARKITEEVEHQPQRGVSVPQAARERNTEEVFKKSEELNEKEQEMLFKKMEETIGEDQARKMWLEVKKSEGNERREKKELSSQPEVKP